ncbi:MAG: response regulator transcription factor [Parabacteroides sp.]
MEKTFQISVLEGNAVLRELLPEALGSEQFNVKVFASPEDFFVDLSNGICNICVIDIWGSEDEDYEPLVRTKMCKGDLPVIVLCSPKNQSDVCKAFQLGADDLVRKPFNVEELKARIKAIMRRCSGMQRKQVRTLPVGKFTLNLVKGTLIMGDTVKKLTTKEFDLLKLMCSRMGEVVERNDALKIVWEDQSYFSARCMDVYVTKLRKILKPDPSIELINVHGRGYKLQIKNSDVSEEKN